MSLEVRPLVQGHWVLCVAVPKQALTRSPDATTASSSETGQQVTHRVHAVLELRSMMDSIVPCFGWKWDSIQGI